LVETTNQEKAEKTEKESKARPNAERRERRERGPPADGIPSKNKVMVANLPYDLSEEKVCGKAFRYLLYAKKSRHSSRNSSPLMSLLLPR
jgi:hypothetical protein